MIKLSERIRELRLSAGLSQNDFARLIGMSRSSVAMYEQGNRAPKYEDLERIADFFNCDMAYLLGEQTIKNKYVEETRHTNAVRVPVYGKVAAGIPTEAITDIEDYEEIDAAMAAKGDYMALTINGDSMEPKFSKGDVVIIRKQDCAETGDYVVVLVNGEDATCKKLKCTEDGIYLISTNPAYDPMFFTNKQIKSLPVRILGKVVELRAKFK